MRNLHDYQQKYRNQPYERWQVYFRQKKVKEILSTCKHDILLEVGCGMSPVFTCVDSYRKMYVVEPGDMFYENALRERKNSLRREDITIVHEELENYAAKSAHVKFDFILLSNLLHEVTHPAQLLRAVYELAEADTTIHINVPNANSFHRLLAVEMGLIKDKFQLSDSNMHFQQHVVFDLDSLIDTVCKHGFSVIESGSYSFKPFTHQQMEDMLQAGLITENMLEGFYKMEQYLPGLGSEIFVNVKKK